MVDIRSRSLVAFGATVFGGAMLLALVPAFFSSLLWRSEPSTDVLTAPRDLNNGQYILQVAGCGACHTEHKPGAAELAGGKRLRTPFGIVLAPNITPHPEYGIGGWTDQQFLDAVKYGIRPDGQHYFAAFPYTSYIKMTDADILDMKAYIDQRVQPVALDIEERQLTFPFNQRFLVGFWKLLYLRQDYIADIDFSDPVLARGAYLTEALGHCGECHTRRDLMSGIRVNQWMQGVPIGEFGPSPDISSHASAVSEWTLAQWNHALKTGEMPSGRVMGGEMAVVIDEITRQLTPEDRDAMSRYFLALQAKTGAEHAF